MARSTARTRTPATPGFAILIRDDTELGLAILIAEFGGGLYEPVGVVVSISEAREIAADDMRERMRALEAGKESACPERYTLWAQGIVGRYREVKRIAP